MTGKIPVFTSTGAKLPTRAHKTDAGMDLYSNQEHFSIHPGERVIINTGIKIAVPTNHVGLVLDKSGLALNHGLTILGGVIDSGYRGYIQVIVLNTSDKQVLIEKGQKIAQLLIMPIALPEVEQIAELPGAEDERGDGGFGSTGV